MNWWAQRTALSIISAMRYPPRSNVCSSVDAERGKGPTAKQNNCLSVTPIIINQGHFIDSVNSVFLLEDVDSSPSRNKLQLLMKYSFATQGITSGDNDRYRRGFWEMPRLKDGWVYLQSTVEENRPYGGRHLCLWWGADGAHIARAQGVAAWGKLGIAVSQMRSLAVTLSTGDKFDMNASIIIPHNPSHRSAIWAYCSSSEFPRAVRQIDRMVKVTTATLVKVPFDLAYWQRVAAENYPNGLPDPYSDDPTQWLYHGHPAVAHNGTGLHVALARLCGYRWPAEGDKEMRFSGEARDWIAKAASLPPGDEDGLLTLPPVAGERPLVERLRDHLAATFEGGWSDALERRLVAEADEVLDKRPAREGSLEAWLRHRAFRQHCALFHQRPFLWHIWDGQADGFGAFLHYHRLTRANLEKLTFSLLGDWRARMRDADDKRRLEAAHILQEKLQAILKGESPLDIFVRWKPIAAQPIGWHPDFDDSVRLNIRPFVQAGVLRDTPNISWRKDRGSDMPSAPWYDEFNGERINDHHLTIAEKEAARAEAANRAA